MSDGGFYFGGGLVDPQDGVCTEVVHTAYVNQILVFTQHCPHHKGHI